MFVGKKVGDGWLDGGQTGKVGDEGLQGAFRGWMFCIDVRRGCVEAFVGTSADVDCGMQAVEDFGELETDAGRCACDYVDLRSLSRLEGANRREY